MRIIGGRFKRRVLASPQGRDIRPTTDRTREAMFNLVGSRIDLDGARVADLFCGSGSLGLEAYSRGAGWVEFVDRDAQSIRLAQQNALSLDEHAPCRFVRSSVLEWAVAQPAGTFDLILADPPYHAEGAEALVDAVVPLLTPDGVFLLEHDRKRPVAEREQLELRREYGKSAVAVYRGAAGASQ
ncbi:MAG: 16S rRNA (guanine(966)-N(2))-methyltransferase RsmD [Bacteroidetes bacterium]|nr:16S rRNA (guanine(966)-N(2))-methyltransferase RsmD [Bacteroidota bacterium]